MSIQKPAPIRYFSTALEHAIVFVRESEEQVNFSIQHFGSCREVSLVVFADDSIEVKREEITLDYQEARLLRDLLNRPEVTAILDREE